MTSYIFYSDMFKALSHLSYLKNKETTTIRISLCAPSTTSNDITSKGCSALRSLTLDHPKASFFRPKPGISCILLSKSSLLSTESRNDRQQYCTSDKRING